MMATGCCKSPMGTSKYSVSDPQCVFSTGSNLTRPAPGYFTEYWASPHGVAARPRLHNLTVWDYGGVSDADFCDEGGKGPTRFIFEQNTQGSVRGEGAPPGNDEVFYQVTTVDGNRV